MTLDKLFIYLATPLFMLSCSGESEINPLSPIVDHGSGLSYLRWPAERLIAYQNECSNSNIDTTCADLLVYVTWDEMRSSGYPYSLESYSLKGDKAMEQQITDFLDPNHDLYNGVVPIAIMYCTDTCKSIRMTMYDKNGSFISDITDKARFYYVENKREVGTLLFNSDKKLLGKIKIGTTIKEYLSYKPLVFAVAHFIFDGIDKVSFSNGNYAKVEIELSNGTTLTTTSLMRK